MVALPQNFVWLQHFSAEELAEFFTELLEALNQSEQSKDWSLVSEVIEGWKATANIKADPVVSAAVDQGLAELDNDQSVSWAALKENLRIGAMCISSRTDD